MMGFAIGTSSVASDGEPNLSPRVTQDEIENQLSLQQIRKEGLRVFSTPFNKADGLGDGPINPLDKVSPGGRPTFLNHGSLLRMNGLDSQTCLECHNYRTTRTIPFEFAVGGVGALGQAAFPGVIDPDLDDSENYGHASVQGRVINPPFSFGSGGIELVGKEMTQELQAQKQLAEDNPNTAVDLEAKGVSFGSISHDGVDFDFSNVEGVGEDLVIRPFGRTGCCATVREFDQGALQFHHGIQPVEIVGADNDADGDGVANEFLEGELCQQGIQFIPDKEGALREIHRVLRPTGRVALTVWNGMADYVVPIADALSRYVSDEAAETAKTPFVYNGKTLLPIMSDIGFVDVSIEDLTVDRVIQATDSAIRGEIMGMPFASSVKEKGDDVLQKIVQETLDGLSKFLEGTEFIIPQHTHLIQAKVG